jgi:hypothetical protein
VTTLGNQILDDTDIPTDQFADMTGITLNDVGFWIAPTQEPDKRWFLDAKAVPEKAREEGLVPDTANTVAGEYVSVREHRFDDKEDLLDQERIPPRVHWFCHGVVLVVENGGERNLK